MNEGRVRAPSPRKGTADERGEQHERPILKVEHLSMKFGGLVAIGDLSFEAGAARSPR
jgi:ABC-type uncharacterized transport system ATPase subunit